MPRYRINYSFFFKVLFFGIALAIASALLWRFQVDRQADRYQRRAKSAMEEGDLREALKNIHQYTKMHEEDLEARVQLAHLAMAIAQGDDAEREDHRLAYSIILETVRLVPDDFELRRTLVDMLIRYRQLPGALRNIDTILVQKPNDKELMTLKLQTLFAAKNYKQGIPYACRLIGFNRTTQEFDVSQAIAADQPKVYSLLAGLLHRLHLHRHHRREKDLELAKGVAEQMVIVNPDSAGAHLFYAQFLSLIHEKEKSREEFEIALSIDPTDAEVLFQGSVFAIADDDQEQARQMLAQGVDLYPDVLDFYVRLARLEAMRKEFDTALEILDRGIQQSPHLKSIELRQLKIHILFSRHDVQGVEQEIQSMIDLKNPAFDAVVKFDRARLKFESKQWLEASQEIAKIIPRLGQFPNIQWVASVTLGISYEQLGKFDLAREVYRQVLKKNPTFPPALAGKRRIDARLKRNRSQATISNPAINSETEEADRRDPKIANIRFAAMKILRSDPDKGPLLALKFLDKAVADFGDSFPLRSLRADLLVRIDAENLLEQLESLTQDMEDWELQEQAKLWWTLGLHYRQLDLYEKSRPCWNKAIELVPTNLPARMNLFDLALRQQDEEAMREAQNRILEIIKDKHDSSYLMTEVKRLLSAYETKKITLKELQEARSLIQQALKERPKWHELHVLNGRLALLLDHDKNFALKAFEKALQLGPPHLTTVVMQVRLLVDRGRFEEAREKLDYLPLARRNELLGKRVANILVQTGEHEAAIQAAKKELARRVDQPETHIWFANLAKQLGEYELAEKSFQRAVELHPGSSQVWTQFLGLYLETQNTEKHEQTFRAAQLQIDAEYLPLFSARHHELQGEWREAESLYLSTFAHRLDEISIARRLGDFYLRWSHQDPINRQKAAPFLNIILRAANDGSIAIESNPAIWAREQAARILTASGDYQQSQKALQLLSIARTHGKPIRSEALLTTQILAKRNDPESMLKAIELLTRRKQERPLEKRSSLELATLYTKLRKWDQLESHMIDLIQQLGSTPRTWALAVTVLVDRGEYDLAEKRLNRLEEISPKTAGTRVLRARIAAGRGNRSKVRTLLQAMMPPNLELPNLELPDLELTNEKQLRAIRQVAEIATEVGDHEIAERLYRFYTQRHPEQSMLLIRYLAVHGDPGKAISVMNPWFDKHKDMILNIAVPMLQTRRAEFGDQYDEEISQFVSAAIREDPDSVHRQLLQAQFLETKGQVESSLKIYEEVLDDKETPKVSRAMAMNRVSFLWGLQGIRLGEANGYINRASEILGPIDDILDTRAIVEIAQKEYPAAIEHLRLSLSVRPTDVKYYHLARAQMLAGNGTEAIREWDQARKMGLSPKSLSPLEQSSFQKVEQQIAKMRSQNTVTVHRPTKREPPIPALRN